MPSPSDLAADGYAARGATIANLTLLVTVAAVWTRPRHRPQRFDGLARRGGLRCRSSTSQDLSAALFKWDGTDYAMHPRSPATPRFLVGGRRDRVSRSARRARRCDVVQLLRSWRAPARGTALRVDYAPDDGTWFFEVQKPAPAPPTPAVATSAQAMYAPAFATAGKLFRVSRANVRLDNGTTVPAATFRCRATLAGRRCEGPAPEVARSRSRRPRRASGLSSP